jgi:hypothetical protein
MSRVATEEAKSVKFKTKHNQVKNRSQSIKLFKTTALYILHSDCK